MLACKICLQRDQWYYNWMIASCLKDEVAVHLFMTTLHDCPHFSPLLGFVLWDIHSIHIPMQYKSILSWDWFCLQGQAYLSWYFTCKGHPLSLSLSLISCNFLLASPTTTTLPPHPHAMAIQVHLSPCMVLWKIHGPHACIAPSPPLLWFGKL